MKSSYYIRGRVGIGTDSPLSPSKLHISSGDEDNDCVVIRSIWTQIIMMKMLIHKYGLNRMQVLMLVAPNDSNKLVISNNISVSGGISFRTGKQVIRDVNIHDYKFRRKIVISRMVSGNFTLQCKNLHYW